MVEINKLRQAHDLKGKICEFLKPDEINQLAVNHSIPHYELINPLTGKKSYWFIPDEITEWVKDYFVKHDFRFTPELVFVNFDDIGYRITPTDNVPVELSMLNSLYKLPFSNLHTPPGIYFLCNEGQIVYIGKAGNIGSRILAHKRNPDKIFDSVYFICCHLDQLLRIEAACIKNFRPSLNITYAETALTEEDKDILEKILK